MAFPSRYTADIADRILDELLHGRTLREACADEATPAYGSVRQWVTKSRRFFRALPAGPETRPRYAGPPHPLHR